MIEAVMKMKVVVQVVKEAAVKVEKRIINQIARGYLLLVGIEKEDAEETISKMAKKIITMRINADQNNKTNLSILDVQGEILSISQFTLCARLDGRRPSFSNAEEPIRAQKLYHHFNECLKEANISVKEGIFGAEMEVMLINDGPFTIVLDSHEKL